jgi:molybdopterin converting factor small subunit
MVKINIHRSHRGFTGGRERVEVHGGAVGECLEDLVSRHPDLRRVLFTRGGSLVSNIDLYVNRKSAYPDELNQQVRDEDDIHLNLLLMGG